MKNEPERIKWKWRVGHVCEESGSGQERES